MPQRSPAPAVAPAASPLPRNCTHARTHNPFPTPASQSSVALLQHPRSACCLPGADTHPQLPQQTHSQLPACLLAPCRLIDSTGSSFEDIDIGPYWMRGKMGLDELKVG